MAAAAEPLDQPAEVASKVLRRAQVSKMTRALQDRLALANIKIKNGWENLSIDSLEPKIELELKRKRPGSSNGALSDTSSSVSERYFSRGTLDSSPLTVPMFSDDPRSGSSYGSRKRTRHYNTSQQYPASSNHARVKVKGSMHHKSSSWKSNYRLPESSPAYHNRHVRYSDPHVPRLSFISETSVDAHRSPSPTSEQDDEDLPVMSFQANLTSSPPQRIPRTPSPELARSARLRGKPFPNANVDSKNKAEDGADLLMFFAASPSPAVSKSTRTPRANVPPSTPPMKHTPLPSSMMNTPGGGNSNFLGFGAATPGQNFNFSDYLNVTPSPAQAAWRTPAASKTPLTARNATRRRLNFDTLMPPSSGDSPRIGHDNKLSGLGMELGGELVSSQ